MKKCENHVAYSKLPSKGIDEAGAKICEPKVEKTTENKKPVTHHKPRLGIRLGDYAAAFKLVHGEWYCNISTGEVYSTQTGKPIKFTKTSAGYLRAATSIGRYHITISKHRIIWIASRLPYSLPINYALTIDHINGNKEDNRIENLRLITLSENLLAAHLIPTNRRFTKHQVKKIRTEHKNGKNCAQLAREYDISRSAISNLVQGHTYREVV